MSSRKKRTIDELSTLTLPFCLKFLERRCKLGECFYFAIRDESLSELCLIEGAIQTHNILLTKPDSLNALWFLFSSLYKKSFIVSEEEIKLYNKFFQILVDNDRRNIKDIRSGLLSSLWFLDEKILKCRLLQIIKACLLPLISFSECQQFVHYIQVEKRVLVKAKNELQMEQNSFDEVLHLFQNKLAVELLYVLEKKLSYVCPTVAIMISQLNF
jgi:hypothetical protein